MKAPAERELTADWKQTVYNAIKEGYRLFDAALDYGNEKEAGEGLARAIKDGLVKREDVCESVLHVIRHIALIQHALQGLLPRFVRGNSDWSLKLDNMGMQLWNTYHEKDRVRAWTSRAVDMH